MKNILNRGFAQLGDSAFITKMQFIIAQLTGNPHFATTNPTLAAVDAQLDVVIQAMTLPNPEASTAAVTAARSKLEQMLDDLADNLESTASQDPVKLATTGYDLRKESSQTGEGPAMPQSLRLKPTGTSGEVQALFAASDRARAYELQTATDPKAGPWTTYDTFSSVRNIVIKGLPRATDIWVRVRALGPNNTKSGWSDPATTQVA